MGRDIKPCLKRILRDAINTRGGVSCIQVSTAVNENMPKTQKSKNFRTQHWYAEKKRKQSIHSFHGEFKSTGRQNKPGSELK